MTDGWSALVLLKILQLFNTIEARAPERLN